MTAFTTGGETREQHKERLAKTKKKSKKVKWYSNPLKDEEYNLQF